MEEQTLYGHMPPTNSRKRTHDQISLDDARSEPHWLPNFPNSLQNATSSAPTFDHRIRSQPLRFPGDGLDYRRPVMSQPPAVSVIDLTQEPDSPPHPPESSSNPFPRTVSTRASRLPRFSRDVIDLEEEADSYSADDETQRAFEDALGEIGLTNYDDSPDVEILYSQTAPQPPSRPASTSWTNFSRASSRAFADFRRVLQNNPEESMLRHTVRTMFRRDPEESRTMTSEERARLQVPIRVAPRGASRRLYLGAARVADWTDDAVSTEVINASFRTPGTLDFETPAFHVHRDVTVPPSLPLYDAPGPARAGYTRTAAEDDVLVCPNCDEELGVGDDELKRSVFVIKKCGHVYCGTCTTFRHQKQRQVRTAPTNPFKRCVVDGCGKILVSGNKTMVQLYL